MSKQSDFIRAPVFGISEDELATGAVNDNEIGTISGKKIRSHSITSDQMAAGSVGALQLQAGACTAFKITVPNRVKGTTVVFSIDDTSPDTLRWTDGVAYLMKMKYTPGDTMGDIQIVQVQQNISAGSYQFKAGDDAYYFYVEWEQEKDSDEPADSATLTMQKSTTYPDSDTAIVLAYAWYDPVLGLAQFQSLDTAGGGVKISGNSIIAGSIIAPNIRSNTITTDKLAFPAFDKSKDTLDSITDGVTYKKVSAAQINTFIDGSNRAITYIGTDGKYQTILQSTAYVNPSQSGLYLTAQHLGFYNATLGGWTVDIRNTGEMFLGSQYNNQYLYWDGNTLTVRGNVEANSITANVSITSPYITLSGSGYIAGGKSYFTDTNSGFWLGYYNGYYTFVIGNSSQYLQWDGTTLTVRGDVQASSIVSGVLISSPQINGANISGGTISGTTINGGTINGTNFIQSSSSNQLNGFVAYGDQSYTSWYSGGVEVGRITYEYDSEFNETAFKFAGYGTVGIKSTNGKLNLYGYNGVDIYSSVSITQSLLVYGDFSVSGNINSTIKLGNGYGIRFYSPSGKGGNFWYDNGTLYFKDENGNTHAISYT